MASSRMAASLSCSTRSEAIDLQLGGAAGLHLTQVAGPIVVRHQLCAIHRDPPGVARRVVEEPQFSVDEPEPVLVLALDAQAAGEIGGAEQPSVRLEEALERPRVVSSARPERPPRVPQHAERAVPPLLQDAVPPGDLRPRRWSSSRCSFVGSACMGSSRDGARDGAVRVSARVERYGFTLSNGEQTYIGSHWSHVIANSSCAGPGRPVAVQWSVRNAVSPNARWLVLVGT